MINEKGGGIVVIPIYEGDKIVDLKSKVHSFVKGVDKTISWE